jgi:cobalt-zinc-cadmium efflux system protein
MDNAPTDLDLKVVSNCILATSPVCGVHDLNVSTVGDGKTLFSRQIPFPIDHSLEECETLIATIRKKLEGQFSIRHTTVQPEVEGSCKLGRADTLHCDMEDCTHEAHERFSGQAFL